LHFVRSDDIATDTMPARDDDDHGLVHVDFGEYYPAFAMNAIPINPSRIRGEIVHVDTLCGDAVDASVDLSGNVVLVPGTAMQCPGVTENDVLQVFVVSSRIAAQNAHDRGAVLMIVYGNDDVAVASYRRSRNLEKRNSILMPVLLIAESDGLNLRAAMASSGETPMFAQLSKVKERQKVGEKVDRDRESKEVVVKLG
jgi:hypothetical protein